MNKAKKSNKKGGRPTKERAVAIKNRNIEIRKMAKHWPVSYLELHFGLDKTTLSKIINKKNN